MAVHTNILCIKMGRGYRYGRYPMQVSRWRLDIFRPRSLILLGIRTLVWRSAAPRDHGGFKPQHVTRFNSWLGQYEVPQPPITEEVDNAIHVA